MMRKILISLCLMLSVQLTQAQLLRVIEQNKLYQTLLDTSSKNKKILTFALPYATYDPETSFAFGFNLSLVFKTDSVLTRSSSINFNIGYSLKKQFSFLLSHIIFSKKEEWLFIGRANYLDFPLTIYQTGNRTPWESEEMILSNGFLFYQKILKKLHKGLFLGLQYRSYNLQNINSINQNSWLIQTKPLGYAGFKLRGLGANVKIDTRNNTQTTTNGIYLDISTYFYSKKWQSQFESETFDIDFRAFTQPFRHKKTVWAFWIYNSFSKGNVVWAELPHNGVLGTTRGYVKGRYRSDYFLAYETELRMPLWWRFWGITFAGISTVSENKVFPQKWNPSAGIGIRFLLKNTEQIFTGADFAWGADKNKGIYLRLGQAF